ncbi:terminase small subunit [Lysinibacillus sphaericus]|uniref:terminase small subunit n=1 Tax=Lysinibacillus sphaericus TaxID=1421 RepID=UPI001CBC7F00|nr:terminase small subunit [Lysinibacillus sphaericus]
MPWTERKLTDKQLAFADYYIELGNATQAYLKAYPNVTKETTASTNGSRMLGNAKVKAYIDERMEELQLKKIGAIISSNLFYSHIPVHTPLIFNCLPQLAPELPHNRAPTRFNLKHYFKSNKIQK